MKNTDKFLLGIVAGVIVLVGVAFAVAYLRPEPAYQADDTPEGVAHNYLLALQQEDYERAYRYLSPTLKGFPASVDEFAEDIRKDAWRFGLADGSTTLEVETARVSGDGAQVMVRETRFYQGGLFDSNLSTNRFQMRLQRDATSGAWQILGADSYWLYCWTDPQGCD
jgi:hypothetical protein